MIRSMDINSGTLFSIARKVPRCVVGNGRDPLERLILADPICLPTAEKLLEANADRLDWIPAAGAPVRLTWLGTHSRGARFLAGEDLRTRVQLVGERRPGGEEVEEAERDQRRGGRRGGAFVEELRDTRVQGRDEQAHGRDLQCRHGVDQPRDRGRPGRERDAERDQRDRPALQAVEDRELPQAGVVVPRRTLRALARRLCHLRSSPIRVPTASSPAGASRSPWPRVAKNLRFPNHA